MVGNAVLVKKYFEEVFKDRFESLGFKPAKTKNLYSIRVINDEIIHIIGLREMVDFVVPFGAVATVYRKDLCLNKSFRQNENWIKKVMDYYVRWHTPDQELENPHELFRFSYLTYGDPGTVKTAVQNAAEATATWIVPVMDKVQTLKDVLDYYRNNGSVPSLPLNEISTSSDACIYYLLKDPIRDLEQRREESLKAISEENVRFNRAPEIAKSNLEAYENNLEESRKRLKIFAEDEEIHRLTIEELESRKEHNLSLLRRYGVY